ncbi:MAG: LysR family transcriptional regulator [Phycicoccus sp.]
MQDIDLNLLPVLRVILEEGNVTRAADRLHLSVSATSRALDRCRRAFADPLLVRRGRGVVPTPRATALLPSLIQALQEVASVTMAERPFDPAQFAGVTALRASDAVVAVLGGRLAQLVHSQAPGAELRFESETDHDVADIVAGRVAIGVGSYSDLHPELDVEHLVTEQLVGVVRAGHPGVRGTRLGPARFAALDHVVVSRKGAAWGPIDDTLDARGHRRAVVAVVPSTMAALAMVESSDATTVAPRTVATRFARLGGVKTYALPMPAAEVQVVQIWHQRFSADPEHRWFRSCVREAAASLARSGADPRG